MRRRQVGTAAPVLAALAGGGDREATVSALYGGSGGADSATSAVYAAIGNVRSHMLACADVNILHACRNKFACINCMQAC